MKNGKRQESRRQQIYGNGYDASGQNGRDIGKGDPH
jgi:hypothetical protein